MGERQPAPQGTSDAFAQTVQKLTAAGLHLAPDEEPLEGEDFLNPRFDGDFMDAELDQPGPEKPESTEPSGRILRPRIMEEAWQPNDSGF